MKIYSPGLFKNSRTLTIRLSDHPEITTAEIYYLIDPKTGVMLVADPLDASEGQQNFIALSIPANFKDKGDFDEKYPETTSGNTYPLRWDVKYRGNLRTAKSGTIKGTTLDMSKGVTGSFTMIFEDDTTAEGEFAIDL